MKVVLKKGAPLGFGGFSAVYRATELYTGRVFALKQSRVSIRTRRTLFQHEARVLKFLSGHPAIPHVYAYGRIEHFEFLSMELLGQTLGDVVDEQGPLPVVLVLDLADQLLSALEHIHSKGLIHRDVKPDNILLLTAGSWNIRVIDFGFTYPAPTEIPEAEYSANPAESTTVFGTLSYASLNAHEGLRLTYRDDLESLAYTFIHLLRGNLPWSDYTNHGTVHGRIRQVRAQKRCLDGSSLAAGLPIEFGELVDYARSLPTEEIPNYQGWRRKLSMVAQFTSIRREKPSGAADLVLPPSASDPRPPSPIQPGQVVLAGLIPSITAEGYSIQAGHEKSYIPDPCFSMSEWEPSVKPCVILQVEWVGRAKAYRFTALPISQSHKLEHSHSPKVPIFSAGSFSPEPSNAIVTPDWPFENTYCYAFKRPTVFYCLPSQELVPSFWTIDPDGVGTLATTLTPPRNPDPFAMLHDSESPELDTRCDAKLRGGYVRLYAQLYPMTPTQTAVKAVDWNSTRAWFDECVKAARHYDICNGDQWTRSLHTQQDTGSTESLPDSYCEWESEEWERQQERDRSLTLAPILEGKAGELADVLEGLDEIELEG